MGARHLEGRAFRVVAGQKIRSGALDLLALLSLPKAARPSTEKNSKKRP
jgi:hypothetical protein